MMMIVVVASLRFASLAVRVGYLDIDVIIMMAEFLMVVAVVVM